EQQPKEQQEKEHARKQRRKQLQQEHEANEQQQKEKMQREREIEKEKKQQQQLKKQLQQKAKKEQKGQQWLQVQLDHLESPDRLCDNYKTCMDALAKATLEIATTYMSAQNILYMRYRFIDVPDMLGNIIGNKEEFGEDKKKNEKFEKVVQ